MLISIRKKFVFVANLKTASSSIERALAPYAEIAVSETRLGKHLPLRRIEKRFGWLFDEYPLSDFFVFGVIRDPVGYMLSLYNFHHRPPEAGSKLPSSWGMGFDAFARDWAENSWQAQPQRRRFILDGKMAMDALLDHANLEAEFAAVSRHLGIEADLGQINVSKKTLGPDKVSDETRAFMAEAYESDYAFIEKFAGKMKGPGGAWRPIAEERAAAIG